MTTQYIQTLSPGTNQAFDRVMTLLAKSIHDAEKANKVITENHKYLNALKMASPATQGTGKNNFLEAIAEHYPGSEAVKETARDLVQTMKGDMEFHQSMHEDACDRYLTAMKAFDSLKTLPKNRSVEFAFFGDLDQGAFALDGNRMDISSARESIERAALKHLKSHQFTIETLGQVSQFEQEIPFGMDTQASFGRVSAFHLMVNEIHQDQFKDIVKDWFVAHTPNPDPKKNGPGLYPVDQVGHGAIVNFHSDQPNRLKFLASKMLCEHPIFFGAQFSRESQPLSVSKMDADPHVRARRMSSEDMTRLSAENYIEKISDDPEHGKLIAQSQSLYENLFNHKGMSLD